MISPRSDAAPSWVEALGAWARKQNLSLPSVESSSMGAVAWRAPHSPRRVSLRRPLRPADDPAAHRVLWGFWGSEAEVSPVAIAAEHDQPTESLVERYGTLLRNWLCDLVPAETLHEKLGGSNTPYQPPQSLGQQNVIQWFGGQDEFGIEKRVDGWRLLSKGRVITAWRLSDGTAGDWLPCEYLSPLCNWIIANWHTLAFGTDVRPAAIRDVGPSACHAYEVANLRPSVSTDNELKDWWAAHAVRSAEPQLPNLFIERLGDDLVFSWDSSPAEGRLYGIGQGTELIPVQSAFPALRELAILHCEAVPAGSLAECQGITDEYKESVQVLRAYHSTEKLAPEWLSNVGVARSEIVEFGHTGRSRHPIIGLLRRSRTSRITLDDIESLLARLNRADETSFASLRKLASGLESEIDQQEPWTSGYRLARDVRNRLHLESDVFTDIEAIVRELGVQLVNVKLSDHDVRGACIGSPRYAPAIVINTECEDARGLSGRRTTMAHELCHLLFDRSRMRGLAHFEGPIGDTDRLAEMRANAFAIELLVPMTELINEKGEVASSDELRRISETKQVSMHALVRHADNIRHFTMS